jgi:hypothetical protein
MICQRIVSQRRPGSKKKVSLGHIRGTEGLSYNLRKIKTVIADGVEYQILELIDYSKQVLPKRCHLVEVEERGAAGVGRGDASRRREQLSRQPAFPDSKRGFQYLKGFYGRSPG